MNSSLRFRIEKWWWSLHAPLALYVFVFQQAFWIKASILYLAEVSIYALVISAASAEQAAEAKERAIEIEKGTNQ